LAMPVTQRKPSPKISQRSAGMRRERGGGAAKIHKRPDLNEFLMAARLAASTASN
jgi:hypothetical protein